MFTFRASPPLIALAAAVFVSSVSPPVHAQESAPPPAVSSAPLVGVPPASAARPAGEVAGAVGLGVGVVAGTSFIKPDTSVLTFKYWKSQDVAIVPRLRFSLDEEKDQPKAWSLEASTLLSFVLLRRGATFLSAGGGVGVAMASAQYPATTVNEGTHLGLLLPIEVGVEHFFTSWFSMGISAGFNLLDVWKQGDAWAMKIEVSDTEYLGSVFFYAN